MPLLSAKIEVSDVLLNKPLITVTRNREGVWNIADLLRTEAEASPVPIASVLQEMTPAEGVTPQPAPKTPVEPSQAPEKPSSPFSQVAIETFRFSDGTVRVVDELLAVTTELSSINGNVKGIAPDSAIRFQLSANVDGDSQGNFEASGQIGPIPAGWDH